MSGLRILQVIPLFSPFFGGAPTVVRHISKELALTNEVSIYTTTRYDNNIDICPQKIEVDGYNVFFFKRNLKAGLIGEFNISIDMLNSIRDNIQNFDVIHLHSWRQFEDYLILKYATKLNIPYVMQVHGTLIKTNKKLMKQLYEILWGKKLLTNASRVIAISPVEAKQFLELGVPSQKIDIVYNGLDLAQFSKLPSYGSFKKLCGVPYETRIILYLGRIDQTKGVDFLIYAFNYAVKQAGLINTKLLICGPDFGFSEKAATLVKNYGLSDKVIFKEGLSEEEKIQAYVDAEVVAYPERFNVWGLVPMEAAACGTPVIVSESNYISNVVESGGFGFTIKYGDVKSFGLLLIEALSDPSNLRKKGMAGKAFVHQCFSWRNSVTELERIYSEVIKDKV